MRGVFRRTHVLRINRDEWSKRMGRFTDFVTINMKNVNGQWERTTVHEDQLRGYKLSAKCILVCIKNAHPDPEKQKLSPFIEDFRLLRDMHHTDNQYTLMPMKAQNKAALEAMFEICSAPGAPFTLDHRLHCADFRLALSYRAPGLRMLRDYLGMKEQDAQPAVATHSGRISFDGILSAPNTASAAVVTHTCPNKSDVSNLATTWGFLNSPFLFQGGMFHKWDWAPLLATPRRFVFLVADEPFNHHKAEQELADLAHQEGIGLYARQRKTNRLAFVPPSPAAVEKARAGPPPKVQLEPPLCVLHQPITTVEATPGSEEDPTDAAETAEKKLRRLKPV